VVSAVSTDERLPFDCVLLLRAVWKLAFPNQKN
jgi:hypothetical protein